MTIRELMGKGGILLAPGIYDALSGLIDTDGGEGRISLGRQPCLYPLRTLRHRPCQRVRGA